VNPFRRRRERPRLRQDAVRGRRRHHRGLGSLAWPVPGVYGAASSLGALLARLATQLLRLGAPVLWLTCGAVAAAAALGQAALAPAIRNRAEPSDRKRPDRSGQTRSTRLRRPSRQPSMN